MKLRLQKKLASKVFKASKRRIKFDTEKLTEIKEAITKSDIRRLISEKSIKRKQKKGHSRGRARKILEQKRKGRRKGIGSRKGKATARLPKKKAWMNKIRAQRNLLKEMKNKGMLSSYNHRILRKKAKGGFFRSKRHITLFVKEHNLLEK